MQKRAEEYWKKKGYIVILIKSDKNVEEFIEMKVKGM